MNKRFPLAKPYITQQEIAAVTKVLKSGILSIGPYVEKFEQAFARRLGVKYACAVNSGTAGLHLALLAAGVGPGDEVITAPFTFVASGNAILYVGAKPVFVDVDPRNGNIEVALIEKKITARTKAILPIHIFGQAADMRPLMRLAKKYRLKVIEDACEALDAKYRGKKVGTFGEAGVFAFYPNKQMTTGEGGMIVTNDRKIYRICCSLRNQGRGENMQWLDHKYLGYNYRLDEMSAAVGLTQLTRLDFLIRERQRIAAWYTEALARYSDLVEVPEIAPGNTHTWFVYVVRLQKSKLTRDQVIARLAKAGIGSKPYLPSIHLFSFYKSQFGYKTGDFPISEGISQISLALPFYIGLTRADIIYIVDQLVTIIS